MTPSLPSKVPPSYTVDATAERQAVQSPMGSCGEGVPHGAVGDRAGDRQLIGARSDLALKGMQDGSRPGAVRRVAWAVATSMMHRPVQPTYHLQLGGHLAACNSVAPALLVLLPPSWIDRYGMSPCRRCERALESRDRRWQAVAA